MNFSSPEKVASVIQNLKDAELRRAPNRALIDNLFNGAPPYTKTEADENKIQWNVNWGEAADLLLQAREQLENAHLSTDHAITIRVPDAPPSKATSIGHELTRLVNGLIRKSRPYFHSQRSKWGSVALHGPGSQMWEDCWTWRPHFVAIGDLLMPTDTELPLENLHHFARRRRMSPGTLFRKTFGRPEAQRDPGWQLKAVQSVLDTYQDVNQNQNSWNWSEHPEKMAELWKQNTMYYETDAVPVIWMWDFYFQEDDNPKSCWYRKILLDNDCNPGRVASAENPILYLYDSKKPHADKIDEILHIQFIDGNNVPPFMYHSCRGLGLRLHDSAHASNRLRCQFIQKVFEDMMLLFRAADPIDRSRLDKIYLGMNYGIIPEGLSFVTRDQRYTPDPRMIEMQLGALKQIMGEGSQQYTQDIDTGTPKQRTAFEVNTLLQQTTRLTGSMLNLTYQQEYFAYAEICRRLTKLNTLDWECKKFQNDALEAKVPRKWIDSSKWEIEVIRVMGNGNSQLGQAQATAMLNVRPMLNPQAQNEVMNDYIFAITNDPKRASRLAPLDAQPQVSGTVHDTELVFGALMSGAKVSPQNGLVPIEVCMTMLAEMKQTVSEIMAKDGTGTPEQVMGLARCERYVSEYIARVEQDETQKNLARGFADTLKEIMNLVKAMAQRQEQAMQAQGNGDQAETVAKIQAQAALTEQKLTAKERADQAKLASKERADRQKLTAKERADQQALAAKERDFASTQRQKEIQTVSDTFNDSVVAGAEAARAAQEKTESE